MGTGSVPAGASLSGFIGRGMSMPLFHCGTLVKAGEPRLFHAYALATSNSPTEAGSDCIRDAGNDVEQGSLVVHFVYDSDAVEQVRV